MRGEPLRHGLGWMGGHCGFHRLFIDINVVRDKTEDVSQNKRLVNDLSAPHLRSTWRCMLRTETVRFWHECLLPQHQLKNLSACICAHDTPARTASETSPRVPADILRRAHVQQLMNLPKIVSEHRLEVSQGMSLVCDCPGKGLHAFFA